MAKFLVNKLNEYYTNCNFPVEWNRSCITPLYKKGDELNLNNYRGITIINVFQKILCKIIINRVTEVVIKNDLIVKEQVGFVRKEEGIAQIITLLEIMKRRTINNQNTYAIFLDLEKAYDRVSHVKLLEKCNQAGFSKKLINFIQSIYLKSECVVKINNRYTEPFSYSRGVRQGCPMSPMLFNIMINEFLNEMTGVEVARLEYKPKGLQFADDTVIFASNINEVKYNLKRVEEWCKANRMNINVNKSVILYFNKENSLSEEVKLFNEVLPRATQTSYLGLEINTNYDIELMIKNKINNGNRLLGLAKGILKDKYYPIKAKIMFIKNKLIPTMTYGCEYYGMSDKYTKLIKRVVDEAVKCICNKNNFQRAILYPEIKISAINSFAARMRARAFFKWQSSAKIIKDLVDTPYYKKAKGNQIPWVHQTMKWLNRYKIEKGLKIKEYKDMFFELYKKRKRKKSEFEMYIETTTLKKYTFLNIIKEFYKLSTDHKVELFKFKTGCIALTQELKYSARYIIPKDINCICCATERIETFNHLFFECKKFNKERIKYINRIYETPELTIKKLLENVENAPFL